ncbi:MAG: chemotaxis protein CheA, partial [Vallitaleaceae bacterium]|nr:chemotaxis protein CheA [Vallitaleaceae bacterium]
MDVSQYLEIFIEEAKEHLQNLNEALLEMEKNSSNKDLVNEIFRVAHTLKGMAATMGYKRMAVLTHDMENVLSEIRTGTIDSSAELLDVLFQCLDALEKYVDAITETGNEGTEENKNIINRLNAILAQKGSADAKTEVSKPTVAVEVKAVESVAGSSDSKYERKHLMLAFNEYEKNAMLKAKEEGYVTCGLTIVISESCVLKSARAFIIFRTLEKLGQIIKSYPSVQDIEDEKFDFDFTVFAITKETPEKFHKELTGIAEVEEVLIDVIEVDGQVKDFSKKKEANVSNAQESEEDDDDGKSTQGQQTKKPNANRTVRVDIERLDNLMNLVSELIIVKNGLETVESHNQNMNEQIEYLERITTNLHDAVMKVRMVPVERVFNRFPRLIRDLSRKLNKNMELHMSGEDTELDRTVIDEIGDPLVHLIRNSGDHGLETPEERRAAGKPEKGNVYLDAFQDGNNVVIEVRDDGKGINIAKVKAKALNTGAITRDQADAMSDQDIIELLFRPSFSTADQISDVSGRGVGLDVVKTKIEALGGDIEVKTELGKGSTFTIRLPLTLAIIQALMVKLGEEKYAIPLNSIQNIEDV